MKLIEPRLAEPANADPLELEKELSALLNIENKYEKGELKSTTYQLVDPSPLFTDPIKPTDLGKLTAEAVLAQYEHAAKSIESMGDVIKKSVASLEASLKDHADTLKLIADAADHYREKGKEVQCQIEAASMLTQDVRSICEGLTKKGGRDGTVG